MYLPSCSNKTVVTTHLDNGIKQCTKEQEPSKPLPNILSVRSKARKAIEFLKKEKSESTVQNASGAYDAAIKEVTSELAIAERNREEKALSKLYPSISLDFLSMKRKPNKGEYHKLSRVPVFSCHRISVGSAKISLSKSQIAIECRNWKDAKKGGFYWALTACSSHVLEQAYSKAMLPSSTICSSNSHIFAGKGMRTDKYGISPDLYISHEFTGIIPEDTQQKIRKSVSSFDDVYLIKECHDWKAEEVTKDPLIIGIKGEKAYIIDHFDCTDIESYVKKEFGL